ncbi:MAG: hypothetical protein ABI578_08170 [Chloroflexota bacterium]
MWRRTIGLVLATVVSAVIGMAASVAVSSDSLGAATVTVTRCTAAGLTVLQNLTAGTVSSVTVGAIPAACGGGTLQLTVNNGTTNSSGSAAVPAGGGSVAVTLAVAQVVTATVQTDLVLVGP